MRLRPSGDRTVLEASAVHHAKQFSRFRATQKQPEKRADACFVQRFQVTRSLTIYRLREGEKKHSESKKTSRVN